MDSLDFILGEGSDEMPPAFMYLQLGELTVSLDSHNIRGPSLQQIMNPFQHRYPFSFPLSPRTSVGKFRPPEIRESAQVWKYALSHGHPQIGQV